MLKYFQLWLVQDVIKDDNRPQRISDLGPPLGQMTIGPGHLVNYPMVNKVREDIRELEDKEKLNEKQGRRIDYFLSKILKNKAGAARIIYFCFGNIEMLSEQVIKDLN